MRLALNPEVLRYAPRSAVPVFNWYLYTYLVCATALLVAGWLLLRTDDRLVAGLPRASTAAFAGAGILLFLLLNIEIADFYAEGPTFTLRFGARLDQDLTYTIGWLLFGLGLLAVGIVTHSRGARLTALALVAVTACKGFLYDLARLGGLYRVASFVGLAVTLALVSLALQKFVLRAPEGGAMMRSRRRAAALGAAALVVAFGFGLRRAAASAASFRRERPAVLHEPGPQSLAVDMPLLVGSAPFRVETWPGQRGDAPAPGGSGRAAATFASTTPSAARCRTCSSSRRRPSPSGGGPRRFCPPRDEEGERLRGGPRRGHDRRPAAGRGASRALPEAARPRRQRGPPALDPPRPGDDALRPARLGPPSARARVSGRPLPLPPGHLGRRLERPGAPAARRGRADGAGRRPGPARAQGAGGLRPEGQRAGHEPFPPASPRPLVARRGAAAHRRRRQPHAAGAGQRGPARRRSARRLSSWAKRRCGGRCATC